MSRPAAEVAAAMEIPGLRIPLPASATARERQERLVFVLQVCAGHVRHTQPVPQPVLAFLAEIGTDPTWEAVQDRLDKERHILETGGAVNG